MFKALSDETRLRILALLSAGELCVCDLVSILELPQSTVSRHLAYLRNAGLVSDRRQGVWMYYRFAQPAGPLHKDLLELLQHRLSELPLARQDALALEQLINQKGTAACR
ncbi:transcriptional regulator [Desulfuromonas versatilis]|uniref:Transcriptional regulator n=1 Tax=Desulfuromonas versatilis TaxID=2802975 RepID=A0ABM8HRX2_9BACT|nr:transcriptional regulator [Desulfuromonas versatilis]